MQLLLIIAGLMFALAAALSVVRIVRGPGASDRVVASDVLVAILVGILVVEATINRHTYTMPIILVLCLLAFAGTVAMARFIAGRGEVVGPAPDGDASRDRGAL